MKIGDAARSLFALALYVLAACGALLCVIDLVLIRENYRRNAATGDFTGASLGITFLVTTFLPATLIAFVLALWLRPPRWLARAASGSDESDREDAVATARAQHPRLIVAWVLTILAVGIIALVVAMVVSGLQGGETYYGLRGPALFQLAIQNLTWLSPMIVLSALLLWVAAVFSRTGRR